MLTLLSLLVAVIGLLILRVGSRGLARAAADAAMLALVLGCTAGGAWVVTHWRGGVDGTAGALAGTVVGVVFAQALRDRGVRR